MKIFQKRQEKAFFSTFKAIGAVIGIVLLTVALWSLADIWQDYHISAEEWVQKAVAKTLTEDNYTFSACAFRENDGVREEICTITGEITGEDTHLCGKIALVGSEFEIYQIADNYYRRDSVDGKWLKVDNLGRETAKKMMAEISPLDFLRLKAPYEAEYLGKEVVNGQKCRKFQVLNYVTEEYLTYGWQEIILTMWVDKKGYVYKSEVRASERDQTEKTLVLELGFDFTKQPEAFAAPLS